MESKCIRCGDCCRNWVTGDPRGTCEYLSYSADKTATCDVWDRLAEHNLRCCQVFHTLNQAPALPDHCGWIVYWRSIGAVVRGEDGRWRPTI